MRTSQLNEITKPLPHRVSIENQLKLSLRPLQRYFLALFVFCSFSVFSFLCLRFFFCASSRLDFDSAAADTHTTLYSCVQARIMLNLTENGYNSPQRVKLCGVRELATATELFPELFSTLVQWVDFPSHAMMLFFFVGWFDYMLHI